MIYEINKNIIPRDIAGRYFLVDATAKDYYDTKQIFTTNQSGYEMYKIMLSLGVFSAQELFIKFIALFNDIKPEMYDVIRGDISSFLHQLIEKRYVTLKED